MSQGEVDSVLAERKRTHGPFAQKAELAQAMKDLMRSAPGWQQMTAVQREGLEHVVDKLGRALCGDPSFRDHWVDAVGYLTRILESMPQQAACGTGRPGAEGG